MLSPALTFPNRRTYHLRAGTVSRTRVLPDAELKAIWEACDGTFGILVKLLIVTGQRRGEIEVRRCREDRVHAEHHERLDFAALHRCHEPGESSGRVR